MAVKRRRSAASPDNQLIEIYEDLAHEDEEIRLRAAQSLLSKFTDPASFPRETIQTIINRLFRGLCSSRKAARLGFSVALTEFLTQMFQSPTHAEEAGLKHETILQTLYKETLGDSSTSGQDERDHYFGRLFGAEVIVRSCILFVPKPIFSCWRELVEFICSLALKKPWLRQECGWLLWTSVGYLQSADVDVEFAELIMMNLNDNGLARTPEAVAVWLELRRFYPDVALPKKVWKHRDPLHQEEMRALAKVMRDAKAKQRPKMGESAEPQGAAVWSQHLHFSWDVLLRELYPSTSCSAKTSKRRISLSSFWKNLVDESLFAPSGSSERKHWGFLLLAKVMATAPADFLEHVFTPNTMLCLTYHLKMDERYLHRSATKAMQALHLRASQDLAVVAPAVKGLLLGSSGIYNFDTATKTKTVAKLLELGDPITYQDIISAFAKSLEQLGPGNEREADAKRRAFADLLVVMCSRLWSTASDHRDDDNVAVARTAMDILISQAYFNNTSESNDKGFDRHPSSECRAYLRLRLKSCISQSSRRDVPDSRMLRLAVARIRAIQGRLGQDHAVVEFDTPTQAIVETAWLKLSKIDKILRSVKHPPAGSEHLEVLQLFYCLAILQLYDEESDAPGVLQDLNLYDGDIWRKSLTGIEVDRMEPILEILLSFASKSSRFFHQACLQAFRTRTSQISRRGLQSLIRVLETKESSKGTQDLFDVEDNAGPFPTNHEEQRQSGQLNSKGGSSLDMDHETLDSDVEEFSMQSSASEEHDEGSEEDQVELEAFDAKLAAALGTRTAREDIEADAEKSDDDIFEDDMPEKELEELDEKLAAVFRARKPSANKKQERKETKEVIINFKRRVLDLVEIYLKQEQLSPLTMDLLLPLVRTARQTASKEIRTRAYDVLQAFCSRCKGNLTPQICGDEVAADDVLSHLEAVHAEAGSDSSRAHASACSKASILLVKTLLRARIEVGKLVDVYAETRKKQLQKRDCKIQPIFFTEWNNWCASARDQLAS